MFHKLSDQLVIRSVKRPEMLKVKDDLSISSAAHNAI